MDHNALREQTEKVLFWLMQPEQKAIVDHAKDEFLYGLEDKDKATRLTDWMIHEYHDDQGCSVLELYEQANPAEAGALLEVMKKSVFSVFKAIDVKGKTVVKDIFTKADYTLETDEPMADLIIGRLYPVEGSRWICEDELRYLPEAFESTLYKGIMDKYNEYCNGFEPIGLEVFLERQRLILYRFIEIIEHTETQVIEAEEDYLVYQSTYVVNDRAALAKKIRSEEIFEVTFDESDELVFRLLENEHIVAETVLAEQRIEIECTAPEDLEKAKEVIESKLEGCIVHLRDEVLHLDDILQ